jgi:hypothetical protein
MSETKKETLNIYKRLLEAQKEIGAIKKDSDNPYFKSKYFDINAILAEVKPVLNKHGLLLTQALVTRADINKTGIETSIIDVASDKGLHYFVELPQGATPQQTGSAVTYYRRYALQSLLALEAEDDDGNLSSGKKVKNSSEEPF